MLLAPRCIISTNMHIPRCCSIITPQANQSTAHTHRLQSRYRAIVGNRQVTPLPTVCTCSASGCKSHHTIKPVLHAASSEYQQSQYVV